MKSVAEVAAIADPMERATQAARLVRDAEAKADKLRTRRDLAILILLRPFADAVAETNAERARLREDLNAGRITDDEYTDGLTKNRLQRQSDLAAADVAVQPATVYETLGVSRNLVNRTLMRMPDGPLPSLADPWASARRAHQQIPETEEVIEKSREIRDTAVLILMDGETQVSNADIARATQLTTARVAQLRKGSR